VGFRLCHRLQLGINVELVGSVLRVPNGRRAVSLGGHLDITSVRLRLTSSIVKLYLIKLSATLQTERHGRLVHGSHQPRRPLGWRGDSSVSRLEHDRGNVFGERDRLGSNAGRTIRDLPRYHRLRARKLPLVWSQVHTTARLEHDVGIDLGTGSLCDHDPRHGETEGVGRK
jgi:hypothetical protein